MADSRNFAIFAHVGTISTSKRIRRSGPWFVAEPWTIELWNITISPGSSTKSTARDSSNSSTMDWPRARMLFGSSLSSWRSTPHLCDPGTPRRQPCLTPHGERASPPSTTGTGEPYAESWCQPANVSPSALFTRQAMLQQRMSGPIRSSKMSSTCGSSAISSTHGHSRCDFVFSFLTWSGARASSASSRARYSRARSGPNARTGETNPCSSNARTCASVRTFGTTATPPPRSAPACLERACSPCARGSRRRAATASETSARGAACGASGPARGRPRSPSANAASCSC